MRKSSAKQIHRDEKKEKKSIPSATFLRVRKRQTAAKGFVDNKGRGRNLKAQKGRNRRDNELYIRGKGSFSKPRKLEGRRGVPSSVCLLHFHRDTLLLFTVAHTLTIHNICSYTKIYVVL
ncbi:hypothetical protein DPX39_100113000 [Trypanosoma brucei equiperdum]|uniref:Uncharacterized protein n=1 Tax=Trypanosoma brucei equiperdum TaxID=630700 RepID=A0A3L6L2T3_9TRYP|nr:hypothetical protein DPX39_100113000 [Trypanosoma brucei equiperdum]